MQDKSSSHYWGEEIRSNEVVNPLVFHFKPRQFLRVAPENLSQWEQLLLENVGLRPTSSGRSERWAESATTISFTEHGPGDCDLA